ncbi:hypothetical protein CEXT_419081 [Caerostris extrusa]|uniref:Uncharacterized protein n=1 Tax=Caerostris extrusa TaxID=172846 RepID=A0AAV4R1E2_CAEEX|nr:hypothetical protein CEXT_419081 [Caerostris extrusa]
MKYSLEDLELPISEHVFQNKYYFWGSSVADTVVLVSLFEPYTLDATSVPCCLWLYTLDTTSVILISLWLYTLGYNFSSFGLSLAVERVGAGLG